ncbi:hypothetical protein ACQ4PT_000385 [Festuca glaucescens]
MANGGRGGGGDHRGRGNNGGGGAGYQGRGQGGGYQGGGSYAQGGNDGFGRGAGFNNFVAGGPSGTANGAGYGGVSNYGYQGGQVNFQGNGAVFGGEGAYQGGGAYQGNGGQGAQGFQGNGGQGAQGFQVNGGQGNGVQGNGGQGGQGFQGNGGQGLQGFQGQFNAGAGFNNNGGNRGYGRTGFRYFRRPAGGNNYYRGRGNGPYNGRGAAAVVNGAGSGAARRAAIPLVYPPAAEQQRQAGLAAAAQHGTQGNQFAAGTAVPPGGVSELVVPQAQGVVPVAQQNLGMAQPAPDFIPLDGGQARINDGQTGENDSSKKAKKNDNLKCYRCGIKGHFFFECTTVLCDYCELADHASAECPMLRAPKPQVIMYGHADEKLVFFEFPATKTYKHKMESSRMGMLSVTGDELTIPQIVAQMRRLVPSDDFHWDVRQVGQNVYKVNFPNKMELERMKIFGTFKVPNSKIELTFDHSTATVEPVSLLPEVWVYMTGIPPKRKGDFLGLWGLGSLFGKTIKVDMPFTREHGVLRILIGCLDYTRIPDKLNVFVVDGIYELSFEVEVPEGDEEMDDAPGASGDKEDDGKDDDQNSKKQDDKRDAEKGNDNVNQNAAKGSVEKQPIADVGAGPAASQLSQSITPGVRFSPMVQKMMDDTRRQLWKTPSWGAKELSMDEVGKGAEVPGSVDEGTNSAREVSAFATEDVVVNVVSPAVAELLCCASDKTELFTERPAASDQDAVTCDIEVSKFVSIADVDTADRQFVCSMDINDGGVKSFDTISPSIPTEVSSPVSVCPVGTI